MNSKKFLPRITFAIHLFVGFAAAQALFCAPAYGQAAQHESAVAFTIPERDLIPEGIIYDPVGEAFFVGSLYKRKIIMIDKHGTISNFTSEGQDSLASVLGMKVDAQRRLLWAVHWGPFFVPGKGRTDQKDRKTGLFKYDLRSRKLLKKYSATPDQTGLGFNDLALTHGGDVYVTATELGAVYHLSPHSDSLTLFVNGADFIGANGVCLAPDERTLFVAVDKGIINLDVKSGQYKFLAAPDSMETGGIDGLYFYRNSLVAVQNGYQPTPIYRFVLDRDFKTITSRRLIVQNPAEHKLPTTGVIVGDWLYYIGNAQLRSFSPEGIIFPHEKLDDVLILKVKL